MLCRKQRLWFKGNIGVSFVIGIFTEDWLYNLPWASASAMLLQYFWNLVSDSRILCLQKSVLLSSVLVFFWSYFYSRQKRKMRWSKLIKTSLVINRMRKNLNTLCKESNLWTFLFVSFNSFLLKSLWEVGARESKKCSTGSNCFLWKVFPGSVKYFLIKPSDTSKMNTVFQNKSWIT